MAQTINNMSVTWNESGTTFDGIKLAVTDTASNAASNLLNFTVGGNSRFKVDKTGSIVSSSGAIIASDPALDVSQTWNNSGVTFTGLKANFTDTASASGSLLMDLQVGGSSKFSVSKTGAISTPSITGHTLTTNSPAYSSSVGSIGNLGFATPTGFFSSVELGSTLPTSAACLVAGASGWTTANLGSGLTIGSNQAIGFTNGSNLARDVLIVRDAANTLAQRNGVNAQTFRLYNTFTDASNYERAKIQWDTNVLKIGTEKAGTGTARALELQTDGTTRLTIDTSGRTTTTSASYPPFKTVRITANNNSFVGTFACSAATNVDAADGMGPSVDFTITDTGVTDSVIGALAFVRAGADNTGDFIVRAALAGDVTEKFRIKSTGTAVFRDAANIEAGTTTGTKIGTATDQKLAFWNATPVVQQVLATGASATVDDVITLLQTLGLCKQS